MPSGGSVLRVYTDTSVIGGCLDEEFAEVSRRVFAAAEKGACLVLLSDVVIAELEDAPSAVREILRLLPPESIERVPITEEVHKLRDAYLDASIVSRRWADDAMHVAAAFVAGADAIVSWNFRHIVRLDKIKGYNRINAEHGYGNLTIISPLEFGHNEEDR